MPFMSNLEPQIFAYILETIRDGLVALGKLKYAIDLVLLEMKNPFSDTMVCTCCCSCLDFIVSYLYRRVVRSGKPRRTHAGMPPEGDNCLRTVEEQPEFLRQVITSSFFLQTSFHIEF